MSNMIESLLSYFQSVPEVELEPYECAPIQNFDATRSYMYLAEESFPLEWASALKASKKAFNIFESCYQNVTEFTRFSFNSSHSLMPQRLELSKALRFDDGKLYKKVRGCIDSYMYDLDLEQSRYADFKDNLKKVISHWEGCFSPKSINLKSATIFPCNKRYINTNQFHYDGGKQLVITLPAEEAPRTKDSRWLTKDNKVVVLKEDYNSTKIRVRVEESFADMVMNRDTLIDRDELLRPACYSKETTRVLPGFTYNGKDLGSIYFPNSWAGIDDAVNKMLSSVAVSVPKHFAIAGRHLIHSTPQTHLIDEMSCRRPNTFPDRFLLTVQYEKV